VDYGLRMGRRAVEYEVIIIGGGVAGLSVGALLAHQGHSVLLLEKDSFLGGRAHCVKREGFTIDNGLHVSRFGRQGACARVLKTLGKEAEFVIPGKPLVFIEGEFEPFPSTPSEFVKAFISTKFLSPLSRLKFLKIFLSVPLSSPKKYYHFSVYDWLSQHNPTEEILDVTRLFCGVAFVCPDLTKVSAREVGEFLRKAIFVKNHISYLKGGWMRLFDVLVKEIRSKGKIKTEVEVEKIKVSHNQVESVLTKDGEDKAKVVISTVPFQHLNKIIELKRLSKALEEYAKRVEPTSGISLDFGLKEKVSALDGIIMTLDPLTMGCFTSNFEPSLAPKGKQIGNWYYYVPQDLIKDKDYLNEQVKVLKNLLQEMFPGLWSLREWERVRVLDIVDGAAPKVGQTWTERPGFTSNLSNLFFAGDTTAGFGWGSEIAFDSALKCAEVVGEWLTAHI